MTPKEYHDTKCECKEERKNILKRVADNRNSHRDNYCVNLVVWLQNLRESIKRRVTT